MRVGKHVVTMHTENYKSRRRRKPRNKSALGNMPNIQTKIAQLVGFWTDSLSPLTESWWSCHSSLKVWICVFGVLGALPLQKLSFLGRARTNCLEIGPISLNCWKHFGRSLDLRPIDHVIQVKVYFSQENSWTISIYLVLHCALIVFRGLCS